MLEARDDIVPGAISAVFEHAVDTAADDEQQQHDGDPAARGRVCRDDEFWRQTGHREF
jgi:hypothetical protein